LAEGLADLFGGGGVFGRLRGREGFRGRLAAGEALDGGEVAAGGGDVSCEGHSFFYWVSSSEMSQRK